MRFESVSVSNLRCLEHLDFEPAPGVSLVCGNNGSGKTSLLEAMALAAQGKSFMTNRVGDLIRRGQTRLKVRASVADSTGLRRHIVVTKERGETRIRVDAQTVMAASVLARTVPLLIVNSQAPDLLGGGPSQRRALIDRTMFHVEHGYVDTWKRYRLALRQRNAVMRSGRPRAEADCWNEELVQTATRIDAARLRIVHSVNEALVENTLLEPLGRLSFEYRPGWRRESGLQEQLESGWDRDRLAGYTMAGPHRADLTLKSDGRPVGQRLSRGQSKAVVCAVIVATGRFIMASGASAPVLLVDDLAAELDDNTRGGLVDMISALDGQHIFTATKGAVLPEIAERCERMFHVERQQPAATV